MLWLWFCEELVGGEYRDNLMEFLRQRLLLPRIRGIWNAFMIEGTKWRYRDLTGQDLGCKLVGRGLNKDMGEKDMQGAGVVGNKEGKLLRFGGWANKWHQTCLETKLRQQEKLKLGLGIKSVRIHYCSSAWWVVFILPTFWISKTKAKGGWWLGVGWCLILIEDVRCCGFVCVQFQMEHSRSGGFTWK